MGFYKISTLDFFVLEPVEIIELIEKIKLRIQYDHELQYIAFLNALGKSNSKNYKYFNAFEEPKKKKKKTTVTDEEKEDIINYFNSW